MDDRDKEFYLGDTAFGKGDEFFLDFFLVQEFIFIPEGRGLYLYPRLFLQVVIVVELIFIQELVDGQTTIAAKGLFLPDYRVFSAVGATMDTVIIFRIFHSSPQK